ncbi:hypothetical protein IFT77_00165 [Frigoribacterium sp. CFBP 13729]|uniref:hypothetical protein n=1 Tax=Frigoribacterium sp. CFBP 13729 TaxID=2775293 RepID=UPI00177C0F69|nr:hypothetical protein [Frigoribacterium sp. CFBP 13729]MBD8608898.1 hypothetical protein [Frigoribacterium sp. CFBP 13729]
MVLDDNEKHLHALADAIQTLGSACARVLYRIEEDADPKLFASVRGLFMDLQLQDRAFTSDYKKHYAEIARILRAMISENGGPYVLIIWTDNAQHVDDLGTYLETLFIELPYTRPVAILPLSKTDYIDVSSGLPTGRNIGIEVAALLAKDPGVNALVQWETDVLEASSRVTADLSRLARFFADPKESRVAVLLRRLATEAVGTKNIRSDYRAAVHTALVPLLQDHLQAPLPGVDPSAAWDTALEQTPDLLPKLNSKQVSELNASLHWIRPTKDYEVLPDAWGSVSKLDSSLNWADFGLVDQDDYIANVLCKNIKGTSQSTKVEVVQIRVGAACDYAQKATGPVPLAVAVLVDARTDNKVHELFPNSTAWVSPMMSIAKERDVQIFVDPRFVRVRGHAQLRELNVLGRVREQLLMELVASIAQHGARPGIVRFTQK